MNWFEKLIDFLSYQLPSAPQPYEAFHLFFLFLTIFICIIIALKLSHSSDKQDKKLLLFFSVLLLSFEVYKQFVFTIEGNVWDYQWYAFPFQFCSVPMYVAFITVFLKPGKVKNAFYNFLGTFCLFAGLAAMFYPNDVFIPTLGISIQTMVHHGSMVIIGFYCLISGRTNLHSKSIIGSAIIFTGLFFMALGMNLLFKNIGETFNMFFISPYFSCHLPVLSQIQSQFGYYAFLVTYLVGFIGIAYVILLVAMGIRNWHYKTKNFRKFVKAN
ncbi:MAG: hypothetical protein AB7T03_00100 [Bacilli bacterium]